MAYVLLIFPPPQNDWGEGYGLMAANIPIPCSHISQVITGHLPFTHMDIEIKEFSDQEPRSLTEEVSSSKAVYNSVSTADTYTCVRIMHALM